MRSQLLIGFASFLQFQKAVLALPTDQQPLQIKGSPDVQTVQAAYVLSTTLNSRY